MAFSINTIVNETISSDGLALIIGATATIAVPPQIAAPLESNIVILGFSLRHLPINKPPKNEKKTNKLIQTIYVGFISSMYAIFKVEPRITMPICKGIVDTFLEIKFISGLK